MPIAEKDLAREKSKICEAVLDRVDKQLDNPLPTPKKGAIVGWVNSPRDAQGRGGSPAIVLERIGPGQLSLQVFGIAGPTQALRPGAIYIQHPDVLTKGGNPGSTWGYWYYLQVEDSPKFSPPKADFEWHINDLKEQRERCLQDEHDRQQKAIEREAAEQAIQAQGEAGRAAVAATK